MHNTPEQNEAFRKAWDATNARWKAQQKTYSVWVLDRANQLTEYKYSSQLEADNASDTFEADGHDVFTDGHRAALARDRFTRFLIKQHRLSVIHIG
jgi:hypothetical protein